MWVKSKRKPGETTYKLSVHMDTHHSFTNEVQQGMQSVLSHGSSPSLGVQGFNEGSAIQACCICAAHLSYSDFRPPAKTTFSINHSVGINSVIKLVAQGRGHTKTPLASRIFQELRAYLPRASQGSVLTKDGSCKCAGFEHPRPIELTFSFLLEIKNGTVILGTVWQLHNMLSTICHTMYRNSTPSYLLLYPHKDLCVNIGSNMYS